MAVTTELWPAVEEQLRRNYYQSPLYAAYYFDRSHRTVRL